MLTVRVSPSGAIILTRPKTAYSYFSIVSPLVVGEGNYAAQAVVVVVIVLLAGAAGKAPVCGQDIGISVIYPAVTTEVGLGIEAGLASHSDTGHMQ